MQEEGLGAISDESNDVEKTALDPPAAKLDFLWLELREDCNLRCHHCYCMSAPVVQPVDRLDHDEWKRLIDEGAELGCTTMQFIGGEPFLYGDGMFDLAVHARERGYTDIEVFSNLTLLTEDRADRLKEMGIEVACSLYSKREEVHDAVTTMPGSFQRTMRGVEMLFERDIRPRAACTVMKQNQDYVEETKAWFDELKLRRAGFDLVRPSGRGRYEEIRPDKFSKKARYRTTAMFEQTDRKTFLKRYHGNGCWKGKIAVSSTGQVNPCIMQRNEDAENVREKSLRQILEGDIKRYWDLSLDHIEVCRDCEYRYACHDCRPVTVGSTGDLTAKSIHCSYDPYTGEWKDID